MRRLLVPLSATLLVLAFVVAALPGGAADHLEAPAVQADGRTDINDVYAFQSPADADNTVLVMTVNPVAGVLSPTTFHPTASYDFLVDNDGDAREDVRYSVRFTKAGETGAQGVRVHGPGLIGTGTTGQNVALRGGGTAWAGLRDDPFFFDLQAFRDQVKAAGGPRTFCDGSAVDFFAGFNVGAIAIEVPSSALGTNIGVWATTRVDGAVVDRMGRPAIATVLIPDGSEDDFNSTRPRDDVEQWGDDVTASLLALSSLDGSGYTEGQARALAETVLLPDVLTVDTSSAAGFLNGRGLSDDVIDLELLVVTGGLFGGSPVLDSDCVGANDVAFGTTFPYLAPAHT